MVKFRFILAIGRVIENPLAHCTARWKMDRIYNIPVNERQKIRHYRARSTEKEEEQ